MLSNSAGVHGVKLPPPLSLFLPLHRGLRPPSPSLSWWPPWPTICRGAERFCGTTGG